MTGPVLARSGRPYADSVPPVRGSPSALPPDAAGPPAPEPDSPPGPGPASAFRSVALRHDGRTYAFGARWLVFSRPGRREIREALQGAGATHWLRIREGETAQVAAYDLPGERGRIFAATEAVRAQFGGDFIGLFELGGDSFQRIYWLAALSEGIVLSDSLHRTAGEAKAVCDSLLAADRTFGTVRLPEGFAGNSGETADLEDFLDLSETRLRRVGTRPWPAMLAASLALAILGGTGLAGLSGPDPAPAPPPVPREDPVFPEYIPPRNFALACERVVASGVFRASAGWSLAAAKCLPESATLRFVGAEGVLAGPEVGAAGRVRLDPGSRTADVSVPLAGPRERLRHPPAATLLGRLRSGLRLVDRQYRLELRHRPSPARPYETHQFAFATTVPAPTWLALLGDGRGIELTSASFAPGDFRWRIEGMAHVLPE